MTALSTAERLALQDMESMKTLEVVGVLRHDITNWLRWGRKKDWKPAGFRCPLGFLYKSTDTWSETRKVLPCDDIEAAKFERVVVSLPQKHRETFVMYHMEQAAVDGMVRIATGRDDKARLLGVQKTRYHELVGQAHRIVLREWKRANGGAGG